jgi:hypothetical protein
MVRVMAVAIMIIVLCVYMTIVLCWYYGKSNGCCYYDNSTVCVYMTIVLCGTMVRVMAVAIMIIVLWVDMTIKRLTEVTKYLPL